MATLVLQTVGSVVGGMVGGPLGAMAGRALGGLAGAAIDNALSSGRRQGRRRAAAEGDRRPHLHGRRADPAGLWPRAHRRPVDLGDAAGRGGQHRDGAIRRPGAARGSAAEAAKTKTTTYSYFANLAVGLCEGPIAFSAASGRMDAKSISRRSPCGFIAATRFAVRRSADRCEGRIDPRARLSRPRLRGVRAPAACRIRQPRAAILLRGHPRPSTASTAWSAPSA